MILQAALLSLAPALVLRSDVKNEIRRMKSVTDQIIETATDTRAVANSLYDDLGNFTDWVGPRLSGSPELEFAIQAQAEIWRNEGIADNVILEEVMIPNWVRGQEQRATLNFPLVGGNEKNLNILSLGLSNGTYGNDQQQPLGTPITAPILIVETECGRGETCPELQELAAQGLTQGRIIVWFQYCGPKWKGYNSALRVNGARYAAQVGALASLACSNTAYSLDTPHTGTSETATVPGASLTIEDTELLDRIWKQGIVPEITLQMDCQNFAPSPSFNLIAEYTGSEKPEEVIIVGGHIDSWDVGTGAMDDMGGIAISYQAMKVLHSLNIRPKRTIRAIGWTAEEVDGSPGAQEYFRRHRNESANIMIAMESDGGLFKPRGLSATVSDGGQAILEEIGNRLLGGIQAIEVGGGGGGADVNMWREEQVPTASPLLDPVADPPGFVDVRKIRRALQFALGYRGANDYFNYHHTEADTISVYNRVDVNLCAAVWAVYTYVIADMDESFPRLNGGDEFLASEPSGQLSTEGAVGVTLGAVAVAGAAAGLVMMRRKKASQVLDLGTDTPNHSQSEHTQYEASTTSENLLPAGSVETL